MNLRWTERKEILAELLKTESWWVKERAKDWSRSFKAGGAIRAEFAVNASSCCNVRRRDAEIWFRKPKLINNSKAFDNIQLQSLRYSASAANLGSNSICGSNTRPSARIKIALTRAFFAQRSAISDSWCLGSRKWNSSWICGVTKLHSLEETLLINFNNILSVVVQKTALKTVAQQINEISDNYNMLKGNWKPAAAEQEIQ